MKLCSKKRLCTSFISIEVLSHNRRHTPRQHRAQFSCAFTHCVTAHICSFDAFNLATSHTNFRRTFVRWAEQEQWQTVKSKVFRVPQCKRRVTFSQRQFCWIFLIFVFIFSCAALLWKFNRQKYRCHHHQRYPIQSLYRQKHCLRIIHHRQKRRGSAIRLHHRTICSIKWLTKIFDQKCHYRYQRIINWRRQRWQRLATIIHILPSAAYLESIVMYVYCRFACICGIIIIFHCLFWGFFSLLWIVSKCVKPRQQRKHRPPPATIWHYCTIHLIITIIIIPYIHSCQQLDDHREYNKLFTHDHPNSRRKYCTTRKTLNDHHTKIYVIPFYLVIKCLQRHCQRCMGNCWL